MEMAVDVGSRHGKPVVYRVHSGAMARDGSSSRHTPPSTATDSTQRTCLGRIIRISSRIVGAKYVVVHADEYRTVDHYDEKEAEDFAYEFLAPYVEYAKKNGMIVAIENVFEDSIRRCPQFDGKSRFGSRIHELKGMIERFNDPAVQCCWDFGHASCAFGADGMLEPMQEIGKHLVCTHVHDNYYERDLHLMPFLGTVNWEAHMKALREMNYQGKFSFELVYGCCPEALMGKWLQYVHEVGEYLLGQCDAAGAETM